MVGKGALFTVMVLWISHASQKSESKPIPKYWLDNNNEKNVFFFFLTNFTSVISVKIQDLKSILLSQKQGLLSSFVFGATVHVLQIWVVIQATWSTSAIVRHLSPSLKQFTVQKTISPQNSHLLN